MYKTTQSTAVLLITLLPLFFVVRQAAAQQADRDVGRTVWDGVYTDEQAERGRIKFEANCSRCHATDGSGLRAGPVRGDEFVERWREFELEPLFAFVRDEMPRDRDAAATLGELDYLDMFSYILQLNNFPAGTSVLQVIDMPTVMLVGPDGPQPLQSGSLVVTIGCLERRSPNSWALTEATEVRRTRNPSEVTPEELTDARSEPLGPHTFLLQDIEYLSDFNPREQVGAKVQAKGSLVRGADEERIQLYSLAAVESECGE